LFGGILIVFPAGVSSNGEKTSFPLSRQGIYIGKYFFPLRQKIRQAIYIGKDYFSPTLKETDRGFTFPLP